MSTASSHDKKPIQIGFLLLNQFTLISLSSAVEPLRMANRISEKQHFQWRMISESGSAENSSAGLSLNVDTSIHDEASLANLDLLVTCGGIRIQNNYSPEILTYLRAASNKGIALGAICTGTQVLAEAGLLDGYRCSIHWSNLNTVNDLYPDVITRQSLFTVDRNRYTSSGGTAPLDLMLHIIGKQLGATVAGAIAEQFICDRIRQADDQQRVPLTHVIGHQSDKLVTAVQLMEANLREPISQEDLANYVGLSRRQLQRLFHKYLECAPSRYYLNLRLNRARELLQRTGMSILEVTSDCGFVSTSHFSKSFKAHFGYSPSVERQRHLAASK